MFNFKKIFSINPIYGDTHYELYFLGIKLKFKKPSFVLSGIISETVAREVYAVNDVRILHKKTFEQFLNCHNSQYITIIGCGPTLKYYQNEADYINIALNKALFLEGVTFKYSFAQDATILKTHPNYINEILLKGDCIKFLGKYMHPEMPQIPELTYNESNNIYRYYSAKRLWFSGISFSNYIYPDISVHPLADFSSVSFAAMHFAAYTHPKRIYLVGLDTCNSGHYFAVKSKYNFKDILFGYKKFKNFMKVFYPDTEIISVNPVGLKGMFKDVYTQSFVDAHPELLKENIEIIRGYKDDK